MALTPNDILNKEFNQKFRGYDANEVNDYLDIIVADYESMLSQINQLKQDLATAKEKNEYFAQLQDSLNSSIVVAQEAADRLKQNARKEAELILFEAEREADRSITAAADTAKSIVTESDALRRSSKTYRSKLEQTIRQQLELVTSEEYHNLFDEEMNTNFNPEHFKEASKRVNERIEDLEEENKDGFEAAQKLNHDQFNDFEEKELRVSETHSAESSSTPAEDNEETRMVNLDEIQDAVSHSNGMSADNAEDNQADHESVLGQTIRIELPKDD